MNSVVFIHIFRNFRQNFGQFCKKIVTFLLKVSLILILQDKKVFSTIFLKIFLSKVLAKYFKIQTSSSKTARNMFL